MNKSKLWRWEHGRQSGGYSKMALAFSSFFKFDCYLIDLPKGSIVKQHVDPSLDGFEHHRINITLRKPSLGGITLIEGDVQLKRFYYFRPDLCKHQVTQVNSGNLLLLSIGWLKKIK